MRNAAQLLRKKAEKDPKIANYIELVKQGKIDTEKAKELDEPAWLKNALVFMIESNQAYSLEEYQELIKDGIRWYDDTDQTKYLVFEYNGVDMFVGERFQSIIYSGDRILIKNKKEFHLRHAEKRFGKNDLDFLFANCIKVADMTIEDYKLAYRQSINQKYGGSVEVETQDSDDQGMFKIKRM